MKVVKLVRYGAPESAFQLTEEERPSPDPEEVLIQVDTFGLNFADVLARNGLYGDSPDPPCILGYEVVGTIEEVGSSVTHLEKGQKVIGFTRFGAYAQYVSTPAMAVVPLPDQMDEAEGTALATQYCTAYYCACEAVRLHEEYNVLIQAAAGGVGTALVQLARHKNCTIFGTASTPEKLKYLEEQGVDYPINYEEQDFEKVVREKSGEDRIDIAFDSVGGSVFNKSQKVLSYGGRLVAFGASERMDTRQSWWGTLQLIWQYGFLIPARFLVQSKGLIGVNMLRIADYKPKALERTLNNVYQLAQKGELKPHVGGRFKVDQISEAHRFLENRSSMGKVVVEW
jgi:NADPH2:quinone reductase